MKNLKKIKLALQGGGAHGAYTWGVADALLEDGRLGIEAIVGTSAGGMNASVLACGLIQGGNERARELLGNFWKRISETGKYSGFQSPMPSNGRRKSWHDSSILANLQQMMMRLFSPYEFNPLNINPLRDVISDVVDFEVIRNGGDTCKLFIAATNVMTGRLRVFEQQDISSSAVMASACLPNLFQAVEIDGEHYWDGGYIGNPPIFPLIYAGGCQDVLIVQINPIKITEVPKTAVAIADRINTLSFNSSLMREMRAIQFVSDLIDRGDLDGEKYPRVNFHTIDAESELAMHGVDSKLNTDWGFLRHLHDIGRDTARKFLSDHFDKIGNESSTDLRQKFL